MRPASCRPRWKRSGCTRPGRAGGGREKTGIDGLRPLFATGITPVMQRYGAVGVDGGTPFGVMRLSGEARAAAVPAFPLVGVVAAGTVQLPPGRPFTHAEAVLESHHTH